MNIQEKMATLINLYQGPGLVLEHEMFVSDGSPLDAYPYRLNGHVDRPTLVAISQLLSNYRRILDGNTIPVPLSPLSDDYIGHNLLANGIGRVDLAKVELIFNFLDAITSSNDLSPLAFLLRSRRDLSTDFWVGHFAKQQGVVAWAEQNSSKFEQTFETARAGSHVRLFEINESDPAHGERRILLRHVALESCNRGCNHCSVMASPNLPSMGSEMMKKWLDIFELAEVVTLSFGEPFYSHSTPDLVRLILSSNPNVAVEVVTAGVNKFARAEARIADAIAGLPEQFRRRTIMTCSLSDYPHYTIPGMDLAQARRQVQIATVRFAIENGIHPSFISFLPTEQAIREIVLLAVMGAIPHANVNGFALRQKTLDSRYLAEGNHGRHALISGRYEQYPRSDLLPGTNCILRNSRRVEVTVTGDGHLLPGCCRPESVLASTGRLGDADLREKTLGLYRSLERRYMGGFMGRTESGVSCLDCLVLAPILRNHDRFGIIGKANFAKVMAMREERRK